MPLASRMRDRIRLEVYDDPAEVWRPHPTGELWAELVSLGQEQYRVAIRWRVDLRSAADAEPALRVLWQDRVLDVLDVTETVPRVEVQLLAKGRQIDYDNLATGAKRKTSWP
jgi:hypothetical protein